MIFEPSIKKTNMQNIMKNLIIILLSLCSFQCIAQGVSIDSKKTESNIASTAVPAFPEKCLGVWEGVMHIYQYGKLRDSVKVKFTAAKTDIAGTYTWKTEYLSPTRPMVKDYKLVVDDPNKGQYILDEGNDVKLVEYVVNDKMYSLFKVNDIYLTSSTELINGRLIFEVTSGRELNESQNIKNYSFANVQRAVLHKVE